MSAGPPATRKLRRLARWAIAASALALLAWIVPVRDRCWDPQAPSSTHVAVSREAGGCVLHLRHEQVRISQDECSKLTCEPGLLETMRHARPTVLFILFAFYLVGTLFWAARWRVLLGFAGVELTLRQVWRISIEAQAAGVLLPGGIGGDALRIASVLSRPAQAGATRAPAAIIVASVLLDRAVGLALIAALAALLGAWSGGVASSGALVVVLAAIPFGLVLGIAILRQARVRAPAQLAQSRIAQVLAPVLAYIRHPQAPKAIALAAALSVLVAAIQLGVVRGLVFALGAVPVHEKWVYVGTAMAFIVSALPALPGAWGTADAAYVFFFGHAGIPASAALAACLLFRLFWYALAVVGAFLHMLGASVVGDADLAGGAAPKS